MNNKIKHIAFIMDGNNRWSKKNSFTKFQGYKKGAQTLVSISDYIFENSKVKYISAFALSKNNLNRSKSLISTLKQVLLEFLNIKKEYRFNIRFIGDKRFLNTEIINKIDKLEKLKINSNNYLLIYINYSGKEDIKQAANKFSLNFKNKKKIKFENFLLTKNIPDPDLLLRTGGYNRLSDFLIYQCTFTELFFLKKLWPDLKKKDVLNIFNKYYRTERKFGL